MVLQMSCYELFKIQNYFGNYYQLESGLNVNWAKFLKVKPTLNMPYP